MASRHAAVISSPPHNKPQPLGIQGQPGSLKTEQQALISTCIPCALPLNTPFHQRNQLLFSTALRQPLSHFGLTGGLHQNSPQPSRSGSGTAHLLVAAQNAVGFFLRIFHGLCRRLGAIQRSLHRIVQHLGHALVFVGGELSHRHGQLVACHQGLWKVLAVFLQCGRVVCGRRHGHVAAVHAPLRGALGLGHPLGKFKSGLLLLFRCLLEDVEVATARGRTLAHIASNLADTKVKLGVGFQIGQIARGGDDDGGLLFHEVFGGGAPLHHALGVHALLGQVDPVVQRLYHFGVVKADLGACLVRQQHIVGGGQGLQHPVGKARGGNLDAVLRDVAVGVFLGQLLGGITQLFPVLRGLVRVQASFLERFLVVVHHHGRALEWHAPSLAVGLAVGHEGGVKALEPSLVGIGLHKVINRGNGIFVDQRKHVRGQQHGGGGCLARLVGGQRLDDGLLVGTRVDRDDLVLRVGLVEIRSIAVNDLGDGAAHRHGVIKRHFQRVGRLGLGRQPQHGGAGGQHGLQKGVALHESSLCATAQYEMKTTKAEKKTSQALGAAMREALKPCDALGHQRNACPAAARPKWRQRPARLAGAPGHAR